MARNIEIKASVGDYDGLARRAAALADGAAIRIRQHDTFFPAGAGRLKLRQRDDGAELIHYERANESGPALSRYERVSVMEPAALRSLLADALGIAGEVEKERTLYTVGRSRIHLDRVAGIGDFVEIEVVLDPGEAPAEGVAEARRLMAALGIEGEDLVETAYVDLLRPQR